MGPLPHLSDGQHVDLRNVHEALTARPKLDKGAEHLDTGHTLPPAGREGHQQSGQCTRFSLTIASMGCCMSLGLLKNSYHLKELLDSTFPTVCSPISSLPFTFYQPENLPRRRILDDETDEVRRSLGRLYCCSGHLDIALLVDIDCGLGGLTDLGKERGAEGPLRKSNSLTQI